MRAPAARFGRAQRTGAALLLAAAADTAFDPVHRHVPLCPFHALTGWQCPLCGALRAVAELARGHPGAALADNALVVAALPAAVAGWLLWVARERAGRPAPALPRRAAGALIALAVCFTILRNLPFATGLRPS